MYLKDIILLTNGFSIFSTITHIEVFRYFLDILWYSLYYLHSSIIMLFLSLGILFVLTTKFGSILSSTGELSDYLGNRQTLNIFIFFVQRSHFKIK